MRYYGFTQHFETLPTTYLIESVEEKRKLFLEMFNFSLPCKLRFNLKETNLSNSLQVIFNTHIKQHLNFNAIKPHNKSTTFTLLKLDTILLNSFMQQSSDKQFQFLSKEFAKQDILPISNCYKLPISKLISKIFDYKKIALKADINKLFLDTVYKRIRKRNSKAVLKKFPNHIKMYTKNTNILLLPTWKELKSFNYQENKKEIYDGFELLEKMQMDNLYFLFPKSENFKRHVQIQHEENERIIKYVPYSFSFCVKDKRKEQKGCDGSCNSDCKTGTNC